MSDAPSQVPAFTLLGLVVGAVALLAVVGWLGLRLRGERDPKPRVVQAGLFGLALTLLALVVAGQLHYGGSISTGSDDGGSEHQCDVWYSEVGLPSGEVAEEGDLSPRCRHDAIAAIGPAVGIAAGVGLVAGGLFFALGSGWRRLRARPQRVATTRYVDVDS